MKIGLIHDLYSPIEQGSVGGEDNLVDLEARLLLERGHEVKKIIRIFSGSQRKVIHFVVSATGRGLNPMNQKELDDVDIIHTNNLSLVSGYAWLQKSKVPTVSSFHNYRPLCPIAIAWRDGSTCFECHDKSSFMSIAHRCGGKLGILGAARRGIFQTEEPEINHPNHLIFTSQKMADAYRARSSISNFDILPNPSRLKYIPGESNTMREVEPRGFLFAGRLTSEKGIIRLIEEWPEDEMLTIAGDGVLRAQVQEMCSTRRNLIYHGPFSPKDPNFYKKFEGLIFPSLWLEGSPLVVIEAISSGVPVIATETSSASELIEQSQCGVLIPHNFSEKDLSRSIHEIRRNHRIYQENGINSGQNEFSPDTWIKRLEVIFSKVIENYSLNNRFQGSI